LDGAATTRGDADDGRANRKAIAIGWRSTGDRLQTQRNSNGLGVALLHFIEGFEVTTGVSFVGDGLTIVAASLVSIVFNPNKNGDWLKPFPAESSHLVAERC